MSTPLDSSLTPSYRQRLPLWLVLWMPLFMVVYPFILMIPGLNWEEGLYREYGLMENLTAGFLLAAVILAVRTFKHHQGTWHILWMSLFTLGAFFFLGEEISWGQHFFGWSTPDDWKELNRQNETNIHNMSGTVEFIFTKVIRGGLSIGCVVGGILVPWYYQRKQAVFKPGDLQFWLWPSWFGALPCFLVNTVAVPFKIARLLDQEEAMPAYYGNNSGELKEAYFALIILIYALVQYRVCKQVKTA